MTCSQEPLFDDNYGSVVNYMGSEEENEYSLNKTSSIFERMKQTVSYNICCCIKPSDSQTNYPKRNPKAVAVTPKNSNLNHILLEPQVQDNEEKLGKICAGDERNVETFQRDCLTDQELSQSKCRKCLSKKNKDITHERKYKNSTIKNTRKISRENTSYLRQFYELTEEEIESLQEKGCIKLNIKMKPGLTISDFNIIMKKNNHNAVRKEHERDHENTLKN